MADSPLDADETGLTELGSAAAAVAVAMPARAAEKAIPPKDRIPLRTFPPSFAAAFPISACVMLSLEAPSEPQLDEVTLPPLEAPGGEEEWRRDNGDANARRQPCNA